MTLLEVLNSATEYLARCGVENPRLNSEHLLAHVLRKKRLDLYLEFDRTLQEAERLPLRDLVRQRGKRIPLQHLLGTVEFYGRSFVCDSRALIPRPETEQLLELALSHLPSDQMISLLDIGTGSGIIAATLALELPHACVDATDLSPEALMLASENIAKHGLSQRVRIQQADLFPPAGKNPYQAIVANLPYIPSQEIEALSPEVQYDPIEALDGGADGLDLFRRFIQCAPDYLRLGGQIWLEIGHQQGNTLFNLLIDRGFCEVSLFKDYQNRPRFITAKK
ncbi:MAG: peptide chain release factor N(5)-glutamine methyltransferase [Verrucomicrobia bacterium]|nr:MAG: peptide chain release factor N(5)-glutamine methyltransferase [Verrucomicrobiota bacterium]